MIYLKEFLGIVKMFTIEMLIILISLSPQINRFQSFLYNIIHN